jgi:NADPH:quinone reductase-like Zn-dependent oxidoreductase
VPTLDVECGGFGQGLPLWGRAIIGFTRPRARFRTLGNELAGVVDAVGRDVARFREGDEVFGFAGFDIGANADFLCLRESASLAPKPRSLDWGESAAAVDGATTALFFLRDKAKLREGQRVLIVGASGSVGTFAVQIAKLLGAHVVDRRWPFEEIVEAHRLVDTGHKRGNVIIDVSA